MKEHIAHITCACGEVFQHIPRGQDDWDEEKTAEKFNAHIEQCQVVADIEAEESVHPATPEEIRARDQVLKAAGLKP